MRETACRVIRSLKGDLFLFVGKIRKTERRCPKCEKQGMPVILPNGKKYCCLYCGFEIDVDIAKKMYEVLSNFNGADPRQMSEETAAIIIAMDQVLSWFLRGYRWNNYNPNDLR